MTKKFWRLLRMLWVWLVDTQLFITKSANLLPLLVLYCHISMFLLKQGFRPESEIPSRHPSSSLVYIGKFLKLKYTVSVPEKISISWSGAAWNRWVMMTRLLLTPASKRCYWLEKRKTENPRRVRLSWFSDTYCIVILRYFLRCVLSATFCGAADLKVMAG